MSSLFLATMAACRLWHGHLDHELIGQENSRYAISTPALVLDLDAMEGNLHFMQQKAEEKKIDLRPHCKSHKCVEIAKRQIEAGAIGISCATIGEAEVMARAGLPGILITSPIVSRGKIKRLISLHAAYDIALVVDSCDNIRALASANLSGKPLKLLIDFDIGQKRTGVSSLEEALELYRLILTYPELEFAGIQAYGGHFQHIASFDERREGIRAQNQRIQQLTLHLDSSKPLIITGGGTGSSAIDLEEQVYTELQVGSYLFMDAEYSDVDIRLDFKPSLFVLSTVISSYPERTIVDAGLKAFATENYTPRLFSGAPTHLKYAFRGDEHGQIFTETPLPIGHTVEFLTSHCDPTVNLYSCYYAVRGSTLMHIWPIEARGLH